MLFRKSTIPHFSLSLTAVNPSEKTLHHSYMNGIISLVILLTSLFFSINGIGLLWEGLLMGPVNAAGKVAAFFFLGHLWWFIRDKINADKIVIFAMVLFLMVGTSIRQLNATVIYILIFQYLLLWIVNKKKIWIPSGAWEHINYEIYLWGFPIGQMIVEHIPTVTPIIHFEMTVLITFMLAWIMFRIKLGYTSSRNKRRIM